MVTNVS